MGEDSEGGEGKALDGRRCRGMGEDSERGGHSSPIQRWIGEEIWSKRCLRAGLAKMAKRSAFLANPARRKRWIDEDTIDMTGKRKKFSSSQSSAIQREDTAGGGWSSAKNAKIQREESAG